ncbi:anthranilate phosphoribosyltransferase [Piedraia hortae CBS 480.64]|uniref:Anthranilate phosphoribosyltransferase n=1 Tax=Piedraia hortae CBS 480.64 TaxID=1314780 RepID=A0A6A7C6P3_9PEZI|nr:anthranilate phosphoribosyltransferase [Piedraia hortae CBS 480.64]
MPSTEGYISISPLLKTLSTSPRNDLSSEISAAISLILHNRVSPIQTALLLWSLHTTRLDHSPSVLNSCAASLLSACEHPDPGALSTTLLAKRPSLSRGGYKGGLVDIVGTGGDGHNTFNISTTSSICASAKLLVGKHGNNSSTSLSGSADLLARVVPRAPRLEAVRAETLARVYEGCNYAFLYAREWHVGLQHLAATRREVPVRTIFNLLGPLANPVQEYVEARVVGVAREEVGGDFAEAVRLSGARKALVVCGEEGLDEISCAGGTDCWFIDDGNGIERFNLHPRDFGLDTFPLTEVEGGKGPDENAELLMRILKGELDPNDPVLQFVLLNTAALLTISGLPEDDNTCKIKERGPGGLRWKEGARLARECIDSGEALRQFEKYIEVTNGLDI